MQCAKCGFENPASAVICAKCRTQFPGSDQTLIATTQLTPPTSGGGLTPAVPSSTPGGTVSAGGGTPISETNLGPGSVIADRYEILQLLGEGGMGAVYKAHDRELERDVALKLIRTELARNPEILARFKQEIILARQVTHRNVIRLFDLNQAGGFKFITMEYLDGRDLRAVLREKGKLAPEEAAKIVLQICRALEAAHGEGVVHRDLKPQNIMLDANGRAYVMDFGIARSAYLPGMTQTGALVGTPEYMSPEQAKGEKLDERSDLFSLGVIFYELLTGQSPYHSDTPLATLWRRIQEKAKPLIEVDPTIPKPVSDIVAKALEIEPSDRFANAAEFAQHLESWLGISPSMIGSTTYQALAPLQPQKPIWKYTALGAIVLLIAVAGLGLPKKFLSSSGKKAAHAPVSVLVADLTNHTGDPIFENTLEPMFNVALEGASFINAYSRGDARSFAKKLPNPTDKLDEQSARLVAVSQGLGSVVTSSLSRRGDGYKLSAEALDARSGNTIASSEIDAKSKDDLMLAIPKLMAPIRKALGDATPESAQLAASGPFTVSSLEVVHLYSTAMDEQFAGKTEEALKSFSQAAELDSNFARAYSGMAAASGNLGRQADAEKYVKLAMQHLDRMTERERYHTRGVFYYTMGDYPKCVEEYGGLVAQYPADRTAQASLSVCLAELRSMPKAIEAARKAVEIIPSAAIQRANLSFFSSFGGDFKTGEQEARAALKINPSMENGYLNLAEAQIGQGQVSQAAESYQTLAKVSARGASMAALGLADIAAYEGRFAEAVRLLEQGAAGDLQAKNGDDAADKFARLAQVQLSRGQKAAAVAAADKALSQGQSVQVRFLAGRIYAEAGETAKAEKLATSLGAELQAEPQSYAKIIQGKNALKQGDSRQAINSISEAVKLLDTWIARLELGRADMEAGLFVEADSEFDRCIKRRGEALELFMDDVPTYGYFPQVYYYQGSVRESLKSAAFADSYQTYLSIRGQAGEDPLLPEIRRKLGH